MGTTAFYRSCYFCLLFRSAMFFFCEDNCSQKVKPFFFSVCLRKWNVSPSVPSHHSDGPRPPDIPTLMSSHNYVIQTAQMICLVSEEAVLAIDVIYYHCGSLYAKKVHVFFRCRNLWGVICPAIAHLGMLVPHLSSAGQFYHLISIKLWV